MYKTDRRLPYTTLAIRNFLLCKEKKNILIVRQLARIARAPRLRSYGQPRELFKLSAKLHVAMPRKHVRSSARGKWTDQQLRGALKAINEDGMSICAASKKFNIPKTTLHNHYSGTNKFFPKKKNLKTQPCTVDSNMIRNKDNYCLFNHL